MEMKCDEVEVVDLVKGVDKGGAGGAEFHPVLDVHPVQ